MTHEQIKSVLKIYCEKLKDYPPNEGAITKDKPLHNESLKDALSEYGEVLSYAHWMCLQCQQIVEKAVIPSSKNTCWDHWAPIIDSNETEKAMRWLGFIQGVLWMESIYSIDEMREHNRKTESVA
jgi:hypothetical protein